MYLKYVINRRTNEDKRRNRSRSASEEKAAEVPAKVDKPRKLDDVEAEEKYKKLLILRKKMELLELKKKKEEEQVKCEKKCFTRLVKIIVSTETVGGETAQSIGRTGDVGEGEKSQKGSDRKGEAEKNDESAAGNSA